MKKCAKTCDCTFVSYYPYICFGLAVMWIGRASMIFKLANQGKHATDRPCPDVRPEHSQIKLSTRVVLLSQRPHHFMKVANRTFLCPAIS